MGKKIKILYFVIPILFAVIFYSNVDNKITSEDIYYLKKFQGSNSIDFNVPDDFDLQLRNIEKIQKIVLSGSNKEEVIKFDMPSEPKDVYLQKASSCSSRSRVIEKFLRYYGYETRHISIYDISQTNSALKSLITYRNPSHAVTEVKTAKGWLIVDSNNPWLSIAKTGKIISIDELKKINTSGEKLNWMIEPKESIFNKRFTYVYGLYSRHGRFFPPYNYVPDINWSEFLNNL